MTSMHTLRQSRCRPRGWKAWICQWSRRSHPIWSQKTTLKFTPTKKVSRRNSQSNFIRARKSFKSNFIWTLIAIIFEKCEPLDYPTTVATHRRILWTQAMRHLRTPTSPAKPWQHTAPYSRRKKTWQVNLESMHAPFCWIGAPKRAAIAGSRPLRKRHRKRQRDRPIPSQTTPTFRRQRRLRRTPSEALQKKNPQQRHLYSSPEVDSRKTQALNPTRSASSDGEWRTKSWQGNSWHRRSRGQSWIRRQWRPRSSSRSKSCSWSSRSRPTACSHQYSALDPTTTGLILLEL